LDWIEYAGDVCVCLQGKNALQVGSVRNLALMTYFIGSGDSMLRIQDFRQKPNRAALETLEDRNKTVFSIEFSKPAKADIRGNEELLEIRLHDAGTSQNLPTLWIGVIEGNRKPVQPVDWEIIKPVSDKTFAFAALVQQADTQ